MNRKRIGKRIIVLVLGILAFQINAQNNAEIYHGEQLKYI